MNFQRQHDEKTDKASLWKIILPEEIQSPNKNFTGTYVVDGGALLHRVTWSKGMKFKDIASEYSKYIIRNYELACIVFDGYDDALSLKSTEHQRRTMKNGSSRSVVICEENESPYTKERFLSNTENKNLISLLSTKLTIDGHHVYACSSDADTKIVSTALDASKEKPVTVVADDTDVAVMLIYHWNEELSDIYFHAERGDKCWSIREALKSLLLIKQHILFIHAWSGCDSV